MAKANQPMKTALFTAAAMLAALPGAALADSTTYRAVYSPVLDATTRSCEITNTGVRGGGIADTSIGEIGNNTAVMRTIGTDAGTAESTAGIQFDMVGANIVTIEEPSMTAQRGAVNTGGTIEVNLPNARVKVGNKVLETIGVNKQPTGQNTVAMVSFKDGTPNEPSASQGSVVVGQRRGGNDAGTTLGRNPTLEQLANDRSSGRRTGTVKFKLTNIDRDTPTTVMQAVISCEPVPVARDGSGKVAGKIRAIRGNEGPGLSCEEDPNCA